MGQTSSVEYLGDLRTTAVHLRSNKEIITDAPTDNNGKGDAFSPTDLVATALASCLITIMGIKADKMSIDITGTSATVEKIMSSHPRRISEIVVHVMMPNRSYSSIEQKILEAAARACPVAHSLHPDLKQDIVFYWS